MNRSLVIRLLRQKGICSRAQLAKSTGLTQTTISNIVGELINVGLVEETGIIEGSKGRRSIGIVLRGDVIKVIGVRLTRHSISVGLYDINGKQYTTKFTPIDTVDGPVKAFDIMKQMIHELRVGCGRQVIGVGVATPGPLLRNEGRIALITDFPGWEQISIVEELENEFQLPVHVEHDANAGALSEWWFGGNVKLQGVMVCVFASHGVGAGIVIDGSLYTGVQGIAGEIGHMSIYADGPKCDCGNYGCLERYCSLSALKNAVIDILPDHPNSALNARSTFDEIAVALKDGDMVAKRAVERVSTYLACGLVNVVNILNPNWIVIGDEMAKLGDYMLEVIVHVLSERLLPDVNRQLSVSLTSFSDDPVLLGAAAVAIDNLVKKPSSLMKCEID